MTAGKRSGVNARRVRIDRRTTGVVVLVVVVVVVVMMVIASVAIIYICGTSMLCFVGRVVVVVRGGAEV